MTDLELGDIVQVRLPSKFERRPLEITAAWEPLDKVQVITLNTPEKLEAARAERWDELRRLAGSADAS